MVEPVWQKAPKKGQDEHLNCLGIEHYGPNLGEGIITEGYLLINMDKLGQVACFHALRFYDLILGLKVK